MGKVGLAIKEHRRTFWNEGGNLYFNNGEDLHYCLHLPSELPELCSLEWQILPFLRKPHLRNFGKTLWECRGTEIELNI